MGSGGNLLVIGPGATGMTAALMGALEGLKTVRCEKSDMVGGATANASAEISPGASDLTHGRPQSGCSVLMLDKAQ